MTNYCQLPTSHLEGYFPSFVFQPMELTWLPVAPSTFKIAFASSFTPVCTCSLILKDSTSSMGQLMKSTPVLLSTATVRGIVCKSANWIKMERFLKEIQICYKVSEQVNLLENLTNPSAIPILPCQFHSPRIAQCASALQGRKMSHLHRPSHSHSEMIQTQRNQALGCQE